MKTKKYLIISVITSIIILSLIFFYFEKNTKEKIDDMFIATYLDGELSNDIPQKNSDYVFDKAECTDGIKLIWNEENWGFSILEDIRNASCNLYFKAKPIHEYAYTGKEQIFNVIKTGYYKLETWGAQGGGPEGNEGGVGSYSKGLIYLNSGTTVYINVGGTGNVSDNIINSIGYGGYNGGGNGVNSNSRCTKFLTGGGGGATHIALKSGTLNTLENNKDDILIVSGGGGGGNYCNSYNYGHGGGAGGTIGNSAYNLGEHYQANGYGQGGTQSSYGCSSKADYCGTFGNGSSSDELGVGAGGGYYGGGGSEINSAGGGSGYIGNTLLTDKAMYCFNCTESSKVIDKTINTTCNEEIPTENCAKKGNGYAKITLMEDN